MAGEKVLRTAGIRGINQNEYTHLPDEVLSANNVWCPRGQIESRPGTWPCGYVDILIEGYPNSSADPTYLYHKVGNDPTTGTFTDVEATLNGDVPATTSGDNWFLAIPQTNLTSNELVPHLIRVCWLDGPAIATNNLFPVFSYYDGTDWRPFFAHFVNAYGVLVITKSDIIDGGDEKWIMVKWPDNIQTGVPSAWQSAGFVADSYVIKIHWMYKGSGADTLSAFSITKGIGAISGTPDGQTDPPILNAIQNIVKLQKETAVVYLMVVERNFEPADSVYNVAVCPFNSLDQGTSPLLQRPLFTARSANFPHRFPVSVATVLDTGVVFFADNGTMYSATYDEIINAGFLNLEFSLACPVEDSTALVGAGAAYSRSYIAQRYAFPKANHVLYWNGRLWAADLGNVYWSAPLPYYKVWPLLSIEPLPVGSEVITALFGFQQHVVACTESTMYRVAPAGEDAFGTLTVSIDKVVPGVGCVAAKSVVEVSGRVIFLGESSLYAYDGTPAIIDLIENEQEITRLDPFFGSINKNYRHMATAVHWKSNGCYLLAVPTDESSKNNKVLVWNYNNNSFWIWTMDVQSWFLENQDSQNEFLFYGDSLGYVHKMVGWNDYNVNFPTEVTTHRMGFDDLSMKQFRQVLVPCSPSTRALSVSGYQNGEFQKANFSGTIDFKDYLEKPWPVTDGEDRWVRTVTRERRLGVRATAQSMSVKLVGSEDTSCLPLRMGPINLVYSDTGKR